MNPALKKFDMTGKRVLITGGATGMGYEMAKALAQSGAKVMIAARRENVLREAVDKLMADPHIDTVLYHRVDLADRANTKELSNHVIATWGGLDVFIGNAGMEITEPIDKITDAAMDEQFRANLLCNIELTRDFMPYMRKQKWGRFIYCSTAVSVMGTANDNTGVYATVKGGLNSFVKMVAAEGGRDGITANTLIIGLFLTDMIKFHLDHMDEENKKLFSQGLPAMSCVGRGGDPEEIVGLVQLLASNASSYLTGACIPIDGGLTAMLRPPSI